MPEHENPDFSWAIGTAAERSSGRPLTGAYLDRAGKMAVRAPKGVTGEELAEAGTRLIVVAKEIMEARWVEDAAEIQHREELALPFLNALKNAGLPLKEMMVRPADRGAGPLVIWIELSDIGSRGTSWYSACLEECFDAHLEGFPRQDCRMVFADVVVPADWPAVRVIDWMGEARELAQVRDKADADEHKAKLAAQVRLLLEIKAHLGETQ